MLTFNDSKNTAKQLSKGRPGGGWDDTVQDNEDRLFIASGSKQNAFVLDKAGSPKENQSNSLSPVNKMKELTLVEVNEEFFNAHAYENKLINDTIQVGGVRIKQADKVLEDFSKAAESLNVAVVASILMHKIRSEGLTFINKARVLYDIECLVKKNESYQAFFKHNISMLKKVASEFQDSNPNNVSLFKNLAESIIKSLDGTLSPTSTQIKSPTQSTTSSLLDTPQGLESVSSPETLNNGPKKTGAFKFIHNKETQKEQVVNKPIENFKQPNQVNLVTNGKKMDAFTMGTTQNVPKSSSQQTNYFAELNNLDFSAQPTVFPINQDKAAGSRLDALWNEQYHSEGTVDCMKQLNVQNEKNKKQQQEIEDKFFGFVSF